LHLAARKLRAKPAADVAAQLGAVGGLDLAWHPAEGSWRLTKRASGVSFWVHVPGSEDWEKTRVRFKYRQKRQREEGDATWGDFGGDLDRHRHGWWRSPTWSKGNPTYDISCWVDGPPLPHLPQSLKVGPNSGPTL
jgi:hypothetical protein